MNDRRTGNGRQPQRGFSLVELMVVIALVLVLVGMVAAMLGKLKGNAHKHQTRLTLQGAMDVASVYHGETYADVNHLSQVSSPYLWTDARTFTDGRSGTGIITGSGPDAYSQRANAYIERFVWATYQMPKTRAMLVTFKSSKSLLDTDNDGFLEIVDGWHRPLAYVAYVYNPGFGPSDDPNEDDFLPSNNRRYFASAGADGRFGNAISTPEPTGVRADNIYGFDLDAEVTR